MRLHARRRDFEGIEDAAVARLITEADPPGLLRAVLWIFGVIAWA
jgi:hypothetical protein